MTGALRKPGPTPNPVSTPFWDALSEGRLLLQQCQTCGHHQHYPRVLCSACWARDLVWAEARRSGTVWTWTVVHRPGHPAWEADAPYPVVIVELDDGPRIVVGYEGELSALTIGLQVLLGVRDLDDHTVLVARRREPARNEPR